MKESQNQNQTKLELQMMDQSLRSNQTVSDGFDVDDPNETTDTVYNPHALEALSLKVEACIQKQRELNFLAREVSQVLKKLK